MQTAKRSQIGGGGSRDRGSAPIHPGVFLDLGGDKRGRQPVWPIPLAALKAAFLVVEGAEIDGNSPLVHQGMRLVHDYVTLDLPRQFVPAA